MEFNERVILDLPLPPLFTQLKNVSLNLLVPPLQALLEFMETEQAANSYVFLLILITLFFLVRTVLACLWAGQSGQQPAKGMEFETELQLFRK